MISNSTMSDVWTLIADLSDWSTVCSIRLLQRNTISASTVHAAAQRQHGRDRRLLDYMTRPGAADELDEEIVRRRICAHATEWRTRIHAFKRDDVHYFYELSSSTQPRKQRNYEKRHATELRIDTRDGSPNAGEVVLLVRSASSGGEQLVRIQRHRGLWHDTMLAVDRFQSVGWKASSSVPPIGERLSDSSSGESREQGSALPATAACCDVFSTRSAAARSVRSG